MHSERAEAGAEMGISGSNTLLLLANFDANACNH